MEETHCSQRAGAAPSRVRAKIQEEKNKKGIYKNIE